MTITSRLAIKKLNCPLSISLRKGAHNGAGLFQQAEAGARVNMRVA